MTTILILRMVVVIILLFQFTAVTISKFFFEAMAKHPTVYEIAVLLSTIISLVPPLIALPLLLRECLLGVSIRTTSILISIWAVLFFLFILVNFSYKRALRLQEFKEQKLQKEKDKDN